MDWLLNEEYVVTLYSESTGEAIQVFNEEGKLNLDLIKEKVSGFIRGCRKTLNKYLGKLEDLSGIERKENEKEGSFIQRVFKLAESKISAYVAKLKKKNLANEIFNGLILTLCIFYLNSALFTLAHIYFGATGGAMIAYLIIMPIVEEYGKYAATKAGIGNTYNVIFNVTRLGAIASSARKAGVKISTTVLKNIPSVILHTYGQKNLDKSDDKAQTLANNMTVHALVNQANVFMSKAFKVWFI